MEAIIGWIIILAFLFGIGRVIAAVTSTAKAAVTTIKDGGDFFDNVKTEFKGMGQLEVRATPTKVQVGDRLVDAFDIEVRGLLGARYQAESYLVTSLFDTTDGKSSTVICALDFMQEGSTEAYQKIIDLGMLGLNQGFKRWIKAAVVFPETLTAPRSGNRSIEAYIRVIPKDELPNIEYGFHKEGTTIFAVATTVFRTLLESKGYVESAEQYDLAKELSVEIAVGVATIDGALNPKEAAVIQEWIRHHVKQFSGDRHEKLKERLNSAFKRAFELSSSGSLNLSALIHDLNELGLRQSNQLLLEFLVKIISADNEVTPDEMQVIKDIGLELGVDLDEIKAMADKAFLDMHVSAESEDSLEGVLGIDPNWSKEEVLSHLRKEFAKWNGRVQALQDETEKEKAQQMLNTIAAARKKYTSQ